jgi:hypothetical protein
MAFDNGVRRPRPGVAGVRADRRRQQNRALALFRLHRPDRGFRLPISSVPVRLACPAFGPTGALARCAGSPTAVASLAQ